MLSKASIVFIASLFAALSFAVRGAYGWNWDLFQHLVRGQAYYRYFTTGEKNNTGVVPYQGRMSFYEKTKFDFSWASQMTIGHPPTTDIILAASNQLFYKRLNILGDMEAYHVYGIVITFLGALSIALWAYEISGGFGSIVAVFSYYLFPLLFSEQHFNIKDPAITSYSGIFLYTFWLGITRKRPIYLWIAAIIAGISLGTKFNILFLAPIVLLWLGWFTDGRLFAWWKSLGRAMQVSLVAVPIVAFIIFFATYPALWTAPLANTMRVVAYYRDIGGSRCPYVAFTGFWITRCIDWQTLRLFLLTIPIPTLLFSLIGMTAAVAEIGRRGSAPLLWFLYAAFVFGRVVLPFSALYGGSLRQVMEIIVPLSLLAGYGSAWLSKRVRNPGFIWFGAVALYTVIGFRMYRLFPNENLYTNIGQEFVNGTVSYGNAYKSGVDWLNAHAQKDAVVSLVSGVNSAIPDIVFRPDIRYRVAFSGYSQEGEYLIELVDPSSPTARFFANRYANTLLQPLYEESVEGIPLVRVWKNDAAYVKPAFREVTYETVVSSRRSDNEIVFTFSRRLTLQSVTMATTSMSCQKALSDAYLLVSENDKEFDRIYEPVEKLTSWNGDTLVYPLAGEGGRFMKVFSYAGAPCDWSQVRFTAADFRSRASL